MQRSQTASKNSTDAIVINRPYAHALIDEFTCSLPFCQCPGGPHDMILLLLLLLLLIWPRPYRVHFVTLVFAKQKG